MTDELPTTEETEHYAIDVAIRQQCEQSRAGAEWNLAEWAVGLLHELDRAEDDIKDRAKAHLAFLLSECKGRRAGLLWKFGAQIREQVLRETPAKKKSVTYATGRAGFRTVPGRERLVLDDEAAAIKWAETYCPEAVRRSIDMKVLREQYLKPDCAPPGCHRETTEARENFYIGPVSMPAAELPGPPPMQPGLSADEFYGVDP